jgi:hypothetical protein
MFRKTEQRDLVTTTPSREEVKKGERTEGRPNDSTAESAKAALSTQGEEMRPKDGNLDGGTAR